MALTPGTLDTYTADIIAHPRCVVTQFLTPVANSPYVVPAGAKAILMRVLAAGVSGAGGCRGAAGVIRSGGGAGSGGGYTEQFVKYEDLTLTDRTIYIDVGAGGVAAAGASADGTAGPNGVLPNRHTVVKTTTAAAALANVIAGTYSGVTVPGGGGLGTGATGGAAGWGKSMGGSGAAGSLTGLVGVAAIPVIGSAGQAGGSGGGLTAANAQSAGGAGAYHLGFYPAVPAGGAAASPGVDGSTVTPPISGLVPGGGGSGGGSNAAGTGGQGGKGGRGGGGGGGGAGLNGFVGSKGGDGGDGGVEIIVFF